MIQGRAIASLIGFLVATFIVAAFGAQFTPGEWYAGLIKPSFNPPNWIFGPVWSVLYAMMAVAAWFVWRETQTLGKPIILWFAQLVLNATWSWLFFGLERPDLAAVEIIFLLGVIIVLTATFFRINRLAGWLLVPYVAWVSFASILNIALWRLNA